MTAGFKPLAAPLVPPVKSFASSLGVSIKPVCMALNDAVIYKDDPSSAFKIGHVGFEPMLRTGLKTGAIHPLFQRPVAINYEGDEFSLVWGSLQSALTLDGGSLRGDEDVLLGHSGEVLRNYAGPELSAARALVAELEAKDLEDVGIPRLAQQAHIEAGRHFLEYLDARENLPKEYRRHIVSRGIFHSSFAGDYDALADLFTESARLFMLDGLGFFKLAAEERVRAALASALGDQHPLRVAAHMESVLELLGIMNTTEYVNEDLPRLEIVLMDEAHNIVAGLKDLTTPLR